MSPQVFAARKTPTIVPDDDFRACSSDPFRRLVEGSPDGVLVVSREGRVLFRNRAAEMALAGDSGSLLGRTFPYPLRAGDRLEIDVRADEETSGMAEMAVEEIDWEGTSAYLVCLRDMTLRKQRERALQEMALFPELNPDPMFRLDRRGTVMAANQAARAIFGENIVGRSSSSICPGLDKTALAASVDGRPVQIEFHLGRKRFLFVGRHCPGYDFLHVYGTDVTERRRAEEIALQAEKLSAVGQLAAGVAHEINNPLGVIMGFAEILSRRLPADDQCMGPVQNILRESKRCKEFVQSLLFFSRSANGAHMRLVDVNSLVKEALSLVLARGRMSGVDVSMDLAQDLPDAMAHPGQIEQIVVNLGNNAVDAMPQGGMLEVSTRVVQEGGRDWIALRIADTGTGIPPEIRSRIFEPFFTTKEVGQGTGLGLSLVSEIVRKHEGSIGMDTEPGRGTVFTVKLPAQTADKNMERFAA